MNRAAIAILVAFALSGCGSDANPVDVVDASPDEPEVAALLEVPAGHPAPTAARARFLSLDGAWDFAPDPQDAGLAAGWATGTGDAAPFATRIQVPYPPEAAGAFTGSDARPAETARVLWYRARFRVDGWTDGAVFAVFQGVDGHATVWLNGVQVGEHDGGYAPFEVELTAALGAGPNRPDGAEVDPTLVVRSEEPAPDDPAALVGLQPIVGNVSGIWRSVYVEGRGARWSGGLRVAPYRTGTDYGFRLSAPLHGDAEAADRYEVVLEMPDGRREAHGGDLDGASEVRLEHGGVPAPWAWSPAAPHLIEGALRLLSGQRVVDEQRFSFGVRVASTGWCPGASPEAAPFGCVMVNDEPWPLRAIGYTASDAWHRGACPPGTCEVDLQRLHDLGFNAVRVRGTTLPSRVLAAADRLGLLVLADLPGLAEHALNPLETGGRAALEAELEALLPAGGLHPSVVAWTLFHEEAGLLHPPFWQHAGLKDWVAGLVHRARALVPGVLVEDNVAGGFSRLLDGSQPHVVTDVQGYSMPDLPATETAAWLDELATLAVPGSSWNFFGATAQSGQPIVVSEAGCRTGAPAGEALAGCLPDLLARLRGQRRLAGYALASLTDGAGRPPGLLGAEGTPKTWGYESYGLSLPDLLGADAVVLEPPLVRVVAAEAEVALPVGVAAGRAGDRAGWSLSAEAFLDTCTVLGKPVREPLWTRELPLPPTLVFGPNAVGTLDLVAPSEPGVVTVLGRLLDATGATVAASRLHLVVAGACQRAPDDERPPDVAVPLGPTWNGQWSAGWGPSAGGTVSGQGSGSFKWDLYTDLAYELDDVERFALVFEAAPCPALRPLPQTDAEATPGRGWCRLFPEGQKMGFPLADAYADARGVLSGALTPDLGWAFGDVVRVDVPADRIGVPWLGVVRVECGVDADPEWAPGLRIFDENAGRWPLRPTLFAWKKDRR